MILFRITSFNVWLKDSETAILEWTFNSVSIPLKLIVMENNNFLPILYLNNTENYFLLEKLKLSTNYSICLQTDEQYLCRNLTTKNQKMISLLSSSSSSSSFMINFEYIIVGISFGIVVILFILFILILYLIKQREKYFHSSKTTTTMESYYQTTGSDTTQIAICNNSLEERSLNSLNHHQSLPIYCYCQLSSNYSHDQQSYHLYHEIPFSKPPIII